MMHRRVQAEHAAVTQAEDEGAINLQLIHQRDCVFGYVVVMELAVHCVGCAPMSDLLDRDHMELAREERDLH